jgi:hypothetical protein
MTYTNLESLSSVLQLCKPLWKENPMIKSFKQPRNKVCQNLTICRTANFKQWHLEHHKRSDIMLYTTENIMKFSTSIVIMNFLDSIYKTPKSIHPDLLLHKLILRTAAASSLRDQSENINLNPKYNWRN